MDKIFEIVKKYIDEYDYYKLLYNGAPDDEFDDYINMVVNEINSNSTAENIAESIARAFILFLVPVDFSVVPVFNFYFTASVFLRCYFNKDRLLGKLFFYFFTPFNYADSVSVEHIFNTQVYKVFFAFKSINVHVV